MDTRFRLIIMGILGAIVALIWLFPTWYPILNPNTVSISYPGLPLEVQADYALLPQNVQDAYEALRDGDDDTETPPRPQVALALLEARLLGADTVAPDEVQTQEIPTDAIIVKRGVFFSPDVIRGATGNLVLYQTPDLQRYMRFEGEFSATRAPDVHIIFTRNPDPYDKNGVGIDYIDVGLLLYNIGTQTYRVPAGLDFSLYPITALYSPSLDLVISTATLR